VIAHPASGPSFIDKGQFDAEPFGDKQTQGDDHQQENNHSEDFYHEVIKYLSAKKATRVHQNFFRNASAISMNTFPAG
jgi:hypothetical protein